MAKKTSYGEFDPDILYTADEIASRLGTSYDRFQRNCLSGTDLPRTTIGQIHLILGRDWIRWVNRMASADPLVEKARDAQA